MEVIRLVREEWFDAHLQPRLDAMPNQDTALVLEKTAHELGSEAVLRTLDAVDGFETPEPPASWIASRGLHRVFSGLAQSSHSRGDRNPVQ